MGRGEERTGRRGVRQGCGVGKSYVSEGGSVVNAVLSRVAVVDGKMPLSGREEMLVARRERGVVGRYGRGWMDSRVSCREPPAWTTARERSSCWTCRRRAMCALCNNEGWVGVEKVTTRS